MVRLTQNMLMTLIIFAPTCSLNQPCPQAAQCLEVVELAKQLVYTHTHEMGKERKRNRQREREREKESKRDREREQERKKET